MALKKAPGFYTAKDLMVTNVVTFRKNTKVSEAIIELAKYQISGAPVVDLESNVIGIFTESDILRYFSVHPSQNLSLLSVPIVYTEKVISATEDTPLYRIQKILMENGFRAIPIINKEGILQGIISRRDVMKYIFVANKSIDEKNKK